MAVSTNHRIRFMTNNSVSADTPEITYSSQTSGFEHTNIYDTNRSKVWKPSGHFLIDSTNNKLYINDGGAVTITITSGTYTTPAALATEIETQLDAGSALDWTVSYSSTTFKFTLTPASSATLVLTSTTNAIWDDIGFTGASDDTDTTFVADEARNHTNEFLRFDLGSQQQMQFLAIIGAIDNFNISSTATVTLEGNNLDSWSSPSFTTTLTVTSKGIFNFQDDSDDTYRYWRINIVDRTNTAGPSGLQIGHVYLGSYDTLTTRNVGRGFKIQNMDPSSVSESVSGVLYFDTRTKYRVMNNMPFQYLEQTSRETLEDIFDTVGITTPFFVSVDPQTNISSNIEDLTMYCVFRKSPTYTSMVASYFNTDMSLREVV